MPRAMARCPHEDPGRSTVPGAVDSWSRAHQRHGRLAWADLLEPAIELASGFPAGTGWIDAVERAAAIFGADGDWARVYRPAGRPWALGETVRLEPLRDTLRRLAAEGAATAYTGSVGARTAEYFAANGVPIDAVDLAAHTSDWEEPIGIDYRGIRSLSHPPNSVGVTALQTLGVLARFEPPPPAAFDGRGWASARWAPPRAGGLPTGPRRTRCPRDRPDPHAHRHGGRDAVAAACYRCWPRGWTPSEPSGPARRRYPVVAARSMSRRLIGGAGW